MTLKRKAEKRKERKLNEIAKTSTVERKRMCKLSGAMANPSGDVINTIVRPDRHSS